MKKTNNFLNNQRYVLGEKEIRNVIYIYMRNIKNTWFKNILLYKIFHNPMPSYVIILLLIWIGILIYLFYTEKILIAMFILCLPIFLIQGVMIISAIICSPKFNTNFSGIWLFIYAWFYKNKYNILKKGININGKSILNISNLKENFFNKSYEIIKK